MRRKKTDPLDTDKVPLYWGLTPNQVVGYNLTQARLQKGWTQDQAADALAPYVGSRWSKANFSAAERSVAGERVRNFDADEIVAFARCFEVPVTYFFMPPVPWADGVPVKLETPDAGPLATALANMVDVVFGEPHQLGLLSLRLEQFLDQLGSGPVSAAQERIRTLAHIRVGKLVQKSFQELERWQTQLRSMANQLEDITTQAKTSAWDDTNLPDEFRQ